MSAKRKRTTRTQEPEQTLEQEDGPTNGQADQPETPRSTRTKRNGVATPASGSVKRGVEEFKTPTAKRTLPIHATKQAFSTPKKLDTPRRNAADRSAKRKSNRRILENVLAADGSDEESRTDNDIVQRIVSNDVGVDEQVSEDGEQNDVGADDEPPDLDNDDVIPSEELALAETPSKRGRGRPKGSKNREITPPKELPPHEWYFWINRPNGSKTSSNTFPASALLSHSAYHEAIQGYKDHHAESIQNLHDHHAGQFPLWGFELQMGFSVLLYGYGDKLPLLKCWADWLYAQHEPETPALSASSDDTQSKGRRRGKKAAAATASSSNGVGSSSPIVVVIDAHHPAVTPQSIFSTIANASLPPQMASSLPKQLPDACAHILSSLTSTTEPDSPSIYLLVSPIHAPFLTHAPMPSLLSQLASHPRIHLLAATDDPHAPLLWPQSLKDAFNWVFHDGTTFVSYDSNGNGSVAGAGVVDTVNELLGRKGARGKGREGVQWVLRSLPENARGVYRILVAEILSADGDTDMMFGSGGGAGAGTGAAGLGGFGEIDLDIDFGMNEPFPEDDDEDMVMGGTAGGPSGRGGKSAKKTNTAAAATARREELPAIPYKTLYAKAVEEFLCSSEMAFRGLLKEFVDHQMVLIKRDIAGQEALTIEMRKDELEGVLEDLTLAE